MIKLKLKIKVKFYMPYCSNIRNTDKCYLFSQKKNVKKFVSMRDHVISSVCFAFDRSTEGKSVILQNYTSFNVCFFSFKFLHFRFPLHYMQWTFLCTFHIKISCSKQFGQEISTIIICLPSFSVKEQQVELWTSNCPYWCIPISYSMN